MKSKLMKLSVINQSYDPKYCPINGHLTAIYNGITLNIRVNGKSIHACVDAIDKQFCIENEQPAICANSWGRILESCLQESLADVTLTAQSQLNYIQDIKAYNYVN